MLYKTMINNIRQRYKAVKTNKEKRLIAGAVTRKRILSVMDLQRSIETKITFLWTTKIHNYGFEMST